MKERKKEEKTERKLNNTNFEGKRKRKGMKYNI